MWRGKRGLVGYKRSVQDLRQGDPARWPVRCAPARLSARKRSRSRSVFKQPAVLRCLCLSSEYATYFGSWLTPDALLTFSFTARNANGCRAVPILGGSASVGLHPPIDGLQSSLGPGVRCQPHLRPPNTAPITASEKGLDQGGRPFRPKRTQNAPRASRPRPAWRQGMAAPAEQPETHAANMRAMSAWRAMPLHGEIRLRQKTSISTPSTIFRVLREQE